MPTDMATMEVVQRADEAVGRRAVAWSRREGPHAPRRRLFVLLSLALAAQACGGGGSEPAGAALPDELIGRWNTTLTYVPAYYTGIVPTSDFVGSLGVTLSFSPNGGYGFELSTATTYVGGNCFRTTRWSETGSVRIEGREITFTSHHAVNSILDSCGTARYVDPAPTGTTTYTMTLAQDSTGGPTLRLRLPTGEDLVLRR